jgi:hypothetical protein
MLDPDLRRLVNEKRYPDSQRLWGGVTPRRKSEKGRKSRAIVFHVRKLCNEAANRSQRSSLILH